MRSLQLDSSALTHNLNRVRHYAPQAKVLAMIKADAYGHGLLWAADALRDAEAFGVACLSEALRLRQAGFRQAILVMCGFHTVEELRAFAEYDLMAVVHQVEQIHTLQSTPLNRLIKVWLKMDSGMHRLGFLPSEYAAAYRALQACPQVQQPLCLMTHLADVDNPVTSATQWQQFEAVRSTLSGDVECSIVNSGGALLYPSQQAAWVRPGIMLYGVSPFHDKTAANYGLQPVMTVNSQVVAIHSLPAGAAIGYGGTYVCPKPMRIGVISYGYGDGYPRHAPLGTPVLVENQRCPVVGRVSMDLITVDLTLVPAATLGSSVTLWGKGLPIEMVARAVGTIPYELLCHVQRHRMHPSP